MKSNYIIKGFQQTVQERFSAQSKALNKVCLRRLAQLRVENTDAPKEKQRHLEGQILPGLYRLVPGVFVRIMHKIFNGEAGFPPKNTRLWAASCGLIW